MGRDGRASRNPPLPPLGPLKGTVYGGRRLAKWYQGVASS